MCLLSRGAELVSFIGLPRIVSRGVPPVLRAPIRPFIRVLVLAGFHSGIQRLLAVVLRPPLRNEWFLA